MEKKITPATNKYLTSEYIMKFVITLVGIYVIISDFIRIGKQSYWNYLYLIPGWVMADVIAGFVHWFGDTWSGLGYDQYFKDFIEHHTDPLAMTKRDYFEGAFDTYIIYLVFIRLTGLHTSPFLVCSSILGMQSNFCHRESHQHTKTFWIMKKLQNWGVIISPKSHHIHHTQPFNRDYCVFSGFCNPFFEYICFWRRFEKVIYVLTTVQSVEMRRLYPDQPNNLGFFDRITSSYAMTF
eukprot:TRINITY_DN550_c0_g1_i1.p1 TRINITY_DN550_c0_g1~~TRINITY_DN550_c0_g1_i1.p1  ORF type:complete len:238 (+),score=38.38 TRINITY_DN550_c0_g1_i1:70-783(+)